MKHFNFILIAAALFPSLLFPQQRLINLDSAKSAVKHYYESGNYYKDINKIIGKAENSILKIKTRQNKVVIFDVDDTALSSYEYTKSLGFGFTFQSWLKWIKKAKAKPIEPVKKFYDFLISKGIKIIFLTGRDEFLFNVTKQNLISAGYSKFDTLICRSPEFKNVPAEKFKSKIRKSLSQKGYKILATIGDQKSDLEGGFTGIKIKLPNYLYIIN